MRKRRTRYEWLQGTGQAGPADLLTDGHNGRDFGIFNAPTGGHTAMQVLPLVEDISPDDVATALPIGVYSATDYVVKRIVGKWWINVAQDSSTAGRGQAVIVGAGIFVARAGDEDVVTGDGNAPIGFPSGTGGFVASSAIGPTEEAATYSYSPLGNDPIREPWLWRRTWVLSNQLSTEAGAITTYPRNTAEYGSVADGPHVDAKSARRIRRDERLFAIVAIRNFPYNSLTAAGGSGALVSATFEYRVLGAMRKARKRSTF